MHGEATAHASRSKRARSSSRCALCSGRTLMATVFSAPLRCCQTRGMPAIREAPATLRARKAVMWTREDCRKLEGMGLLPERWELVQGEIINKMGTNLPHSMMAQRLVAWLMSAFPNDCILPTCSIDVAPEDNTTSEPEPGITILNRPAGQLGRNPMPGDIVLIVEVSDTTLDHDLGPKAMLYASAGIQEYWVIDVNGRRIHQHREPAAGNYVSIRVVEAGDALSPLAKPDAALPLETIFG